MTVDGTQDEGTDLIMARLGSLTSQSLTHAPTRIESVPSADGLLVQVVARVKEDDAPWRPITDTFVLSPRDGGLYVRTWLRMTLPA